ncbi:anti-sigma factor antagonist [Alkalinema sp. FACHB-956]|uniref:anti-sigma factor antagonist n=1 Tax=Alkalinema sp. FACHB-956 TaxID=2692768 RepID=UPI001687AB3F|nr:STAS domain-containing protein [Alkalinema sp. FACHB-956]
MDSTVQVIYPFGLLDSIQGNQLRQNINQLVDNGHTCILVDCRDVELMDSSGLSALVMAFQKVRSAGGTLGLRAINDQVRMLLELTAMDGVFQIFPKDITPQEATMGQ